MVNENQTNKIVYLYKYRSLSDEDRKNDSENTKAYSMRIFTHNEIYFAPFKTFNDPFDCRAHWCLDTSDQKAEKYAQKFNEDLLEKFIEVYISSNENLKDDVKQKAIKLTRTLELFNFDKEFVRLLGEVHQKEILDSLNENYGIFSLSGRYDSILLYSHYADYHRGLCLQFSTDKNVSDDFFKYVFPVEYNNNYPEINMSAPNPWKAFFRKSPEWSYEAEFRLVREGKPGVYHFPQNILTGVIFGCNISDADKMLVKDWVKGRKDFKFYQAIPKKNSYGLDFILG